MFEEGARRLLEERKRLKMNQDAMAEAAQVAKSTYCNYEAGKRAPDALAPATLQWRAWQREQAKGLMRGAWGDSLCG